MILTPVTIKRVRDDVFIINAANGVFLATCDKPAVTDLVAAAITAYVECKDGFDLEAEIVAAAERSIAGGVG